VTPGLSRVLPTATQNVVEAQLTPERVLPTVDAGLGLVTIDHAVPFHASTRLSV